MELYFENPKFHNGKNITCRRGVKWDACRHENVYIVATNAPDNILHVVDITTRLFRFCDLTDADVTNEHDPACRTVAGLLDAMQKVYDKFDPREIITLVEFEIG